MKKFIILVWFVSLLYADYSYYKNGELIELKQLKEMRNVDISPKKIFQTADGHKITITNEILVECKENINCEKVLKNFNLENFSKLTDKIIVIKVDNIDNIFSISKKLFESGKVKYAHPNIIKAKIKR